MEGPRVRMPFTGDWKGVRDAERGRGRGGVASTVVSRSSAESSSVALSAAEIFLRRFRFLEAPPLRLRVSFCAGSFCSKYRGRISETSTPEICR